ncbi:hypothetical protein PTKIN_Ptkin07bG0282300 [Pterospermum kingtungense]
MASPKPHFFRVVLEETIRSGKLGIPSKFTRDYGNALSSPISIKVPNGELWEMGLTKTDGKMWLQNGWRKFAEHYHLKFGHFLVFRYEGNCRFHVLIFDRTTTEIEYPCNEEIQQQAVKIEESEDDEPVQIVNEISTGTREKPELQCPRPNKMMRENPGDISTIQQVETDEKSEALQRASSAFKSTNPFFLVFMGPTYVNSKSNCSLSIPIEFSRKYLNHHGDVVLCDSNGKTWATEYCSVPGINGRPYVKLCSGWRTFVRDNKLQVGDVCAFELINGIEISFKVFIYRGKKEDFHESRAFTDAFCPAKREAGTSSNQQRSAEPLKASETAPRRAKKAHERALQRALAFTSENPFFVVVLRPSYIQAHVLCIPNQFARKHFNKTLTNVDVILLSNGKSWPAEYRQRNVGYPNGKICNGWRAFAKDNNLKVGDVCVLEMTSDAKISFKVFIFQAIADADCHPSQGVNQEPVGLTSQSPKAARERASTPLSFRTVVLPSHLKEQHMGIPFGFVEQHFKPNIEMLKLQVADRSWPVKITRDSCHRRAKLTSGWIAFARENFLRVGDICVYELDTVSNVMLKVSISRYFH